MIQFLTTKYTNHTKTNSLAVVLLDQLLDLPVELFRRCFASVRNQLFGVSTYFSNVSQLGTLNWKQNTVGAGKRIEYSSVLPSYDDILQLVGRAILEIK